MDFASEYVVKTNDEDIEDPDDAAFGQFGAGNTSDDSDDAFGYEACIMEFEDDEDTEKNKGSSVSTGKGGPAKIPSNTVNFPMKVLIDEPADKELPRNQLIQCKGPGCQVVLSHIDKPGEDQVWQCKFCGHRQKVENWPDFEDKEDILYVEAPGDLALMKVKEIPLPEDDVVIFVIDVSGSMCLPVKGSEGFSRLRFDNLSEVLQEILRQEHQRVMNQMALNQQLPALPDGSAPVHISRLQTVKAGLIEQLRKMPSTKRVGLVSFSSMVTIHGDCLGQDEPIYMVETLTYDQLKQFGERQPPLRPLADSLTALETKIKNLCDEGQTALGPALTVAMAMAQAEAGSKVILCTDGVANYGLGRREAPVVEINNFYDKVLTNCKDYGVAMSVVSFDDCDLVGRLGEVPKETGGQIEKVNCATADFQNKLDQDLQHPTYATEVHTRFSVHKDMYIVEKTKPEPTPAEPKELKNHCTENVGNINMTSKLLYTFAYRPEIVNPPPTPTPASGSINAKAASDNGIPAPKAATTQDQTSMDTTVPGSQHPKREATPFKDNSNNGNTSSNTTADNIEVEINGEPTQQPFQYEVSFKTRTGQEGIRVWTLSKPVTSSADKAQQHSNSQTMVNNFIQQSSAEILSNVGNKRDLDKSCRHARKNCDELKIKCENEIQLGKKLEDFQDILLNISKQGHVSDETANRLRQLEKGQDTAV